MDNIFKDSLNELVDVKTRDIDLKSVVENLSESVWSIDLTSEPYKIYYHNDPHSRNGDVESDPNLPATIDAWQSTIHIEDRDRVLDEVVNALSRGSASYSYRAEREKGEYKYFRDRISVSYEEGKPVRLDGITIDIDNIRRSRLNLELSQQRLKSIVDALPDPVFISTKKGGKVIFANEVLFKAYEMSPADFLGKKVFQFYSSSEGRRAYLEDLTREGHVQNHELTLKNRNGESFWVSASTMPLEFQNEECLITILQDITVRKKLERDLKESNERYQLAVEGTNDVIWEYDFNTKNSYVSPQFWSGMGFAPEENALNDQLFTKYLHEEDKEDFLLTLSGCFKEKRNDITLELRLIGENQKLIWALFKAGIIYEEGLPVRAVGSLSNITSLKVAQSKLKESEAKYKLISENSSDCICLQTPRGDFVFVSPSSLEILGYEPEEMQSLNIEDIIHDDDLGLVNGKTRLVIKGEEKTASAVYRAKHKSGKEVWLETIVGAIFDEGGEAQYVQTSTRDVTDRIESQKQLKESQERYKFITDNSNDIVTLMDLEGNYLFVTPSIKETMGYEPEEMLGRNTTEFMHPEDLPEIMASWGEAVENKEKDGHGVFRFLHKSGEWRWIEVNGGVIVNDEGEPIYIRSNKIDITEKRRTEDKLRKQEEKYKLVSENSSDVIALHTSDGRFTFLSPSCYRLSGFTVDEAFQIKDGKALMHPDDWKKVSEVFIETIKKKNKGSITSFRLKMKDGEYKWVGVSMSAVLGDDDRTQYVLTSTRDITEIMKVIEKERQLNKLKSSFISMASHEFRTPLTTIQSSTELISMYMDNSENAVDTKLAKHIGRIKTELERLNALLKDVFTLGRIDVGKTKLNREMTSIKSIIKQVLLESTVTHKGRKVSLEIEGDERQVSLDSQLIGHALANLIHNALKYSEGSNDPDVILVYKPESVEVHVQDYGIGIPEKDRQGLFESFTRASNVGDIEGTGLGLVIVKQFIEMHGGTVSFETKLKEGTRFSMILPEV